MSKEKIDKLIGEINDLKVSELIQVFNGVLGIHNNCQNEEEKDSKDTKDNKDKENYDEQEEITFDVMLLAAGANKIAVIRVIRELTGLNLKDAKELVDNAPSAVKVDVSKAEGQNIVSKLMDVGAEAYIV